ncbi:MAG: cation:proton antiporter [Puniceicoccales bacterium]|jgi:CPA2 family monovalent cation:H+ antiporter-2|nr:cation:proton antiporter [Puniceicoccales bacterium]
MHDISLITTIAFGLTAALFLGLLAKKIGLSPIVGYLLAGIVVGPYSPGFVGDVELAKQLAEIGVILLMFGVGLHFHLKDLLAVRSIAIPGALGQSTAATLCGLLVVLAAGWSIQSGLVLGVALSVASTVVLLRVLMDHNMVETIEGKVAVGWLVVEDIITVVVLVLLPALAVDQAVVEAGAEGAGGSWMKLAIAAGIAVAKMGILGAIVVVAGAKLVPWFLLKIARSRSRELFTLAVLVMALAVATLGYTVFGASMALGAFLAGMVVGQSKVSHQAAADALPMRDAFAVLFFVSVGMLFDWRTILHNPWLVVGLTGVIIIVKPVVAFVIVLISGHTLRTGLTVAAGLAQIGEFSFIVAETAKNLGIIEDTGHHALVASAIISISINPWLFKRMMALEPWIQKHPRLNRFLNRNATARGNKENITEISHHPKPGAIIVGYGPVGRTLARQVEKWNIEPMIVDMNVDTVLALHAEKKHALFGDATHADILEQANIKTAAYLIISLPDSTIGMAVLTKAKELNPNITAFVRVRYIGEGEMLQEAGADVVCYDEVGAATTLANALDSYEEKASESTLASPI